MFQLSNKSYINNKANNITIIQKSLKKKQYTNEKNFYLKYNYFLSILPEYNHTHEFSKNIFWFWFQTLENAPLLVQACLNSIKKNNKNHEIIIINKNNINKYVHFPSYILKRLHNKCLDLTHFSDLLRLELLIKYGGTWIDATVLMTNYNKTFFYNDLFFFQAFNNKKHSGSNWFLSAEKNSPVLRVTLDLLYEYWRENYKLSYYFIFHIFFKMAYDRYMKDYKNMPKISNILGHRLQHELLKPFHLKRYKQILDSISIHKLTYKKKSNITKGLFYNYIIKEFGLK